MRLNHLSLTNFRNYSRLEQDMFPGALVLVWEHPRVPIGPGVAVQAVVAVAAWTFYATMGSRRNPTDNDRPT